MSLRQGLRFFLTYVGFSSPFSTIQMNRAETSLVLLCSFGLSKTFLLKLVNKIKLHYRPNIEWRHSGLMRPEWRRLGWMCPE